jgi:hypothetical protein
MGKKSTRIYDREHALQNTVWRVMIVLRAIIDKYFDVFATEGMQNHIRHQSPKEERDKVATVEENKRNEKEKSNRNKKQRTFQPGDLVLVRKQVTPSAIEGKPAKLTLKARGPYRILEEAGENSYRILKLPVIGQCSLYWLGKQLGVSSCGVRLVRRKSSLQLNIGSPPPSYVPLLLANLHC